MPTNGVEPLPAETHDPTTETPDPTTAAVLVIHGIGEQPPYQTLDAFVQGVARQYNIHENQLVHRLVPMGDGILSSIRMPLSKPTPRGGARTLDFYEFHWAGMVEGRIGLRAVLWWLARTALTPLSLWAQQAVVLVEAAKQKEAAGAPPAEAARPSKVHLTGLFLGEVGRSLLLPITAALLIAPFVYAATQQDALKKAWAGLYAAAVTGRTTWQVAGALALLALTALLVIAASRGAIMILRQLAFRAPTERASLKQWAIASALTVPAALALAWDVSAALHLQTGRLLWAMLLFLCRWSVALPLASLALSTWLGRLFVAYLGDVALYTTADENSEYFRTRTAILERSTSIVRFLCEEKGYRAVYLAGHSLGSVIAYDTINRYLKDVRAKRKWAYEGVHRLRGLLTFGSPLDAVYYFFRTEVDAREPIRAQILSSLHGFRKRPSGRDYGNFELAKYKVDALKQCRWLNVYSLTDLVSRKLVFYEVDDQQRRTYRWGPIRAHLAYWHDPGFYNLVKEWL